MAIATSFMYRWLFFFFPKHSFHLLGGNIETSHTGFLLVRNPHARESDCHKKTISPSLSCWLWIIMEVQCYTDMFFCKDVINIIVMFWYLVHGCSCYLFHYIPPRDSATCITCLFYYSVFFSC